MSMTPGDVFLFSRCDWGLRKALAAELGERGLEALDSPGILCHGFAELGQRLNYG